MEHAFLFPAVRHFAERDGVFLLPAGCTVSAEPDFLPAVQTALSLFPAFPAGTGADGCVTVRRDAALEKEGYTLTVRPDGVTLAASSACGAFYAAITFCQLAGGGREIPCCDIADAPGLRLRGVLLDVSRGKVPTLQTLCETVDLLARCKLNHLELYIEGLSFAYPSFGALWADETPLTPAEVRTLDAYCRARFVDLVPCQNGLGHMGRWLAEPALRPLAECPDGFSVYGHSFPPTTLDPEDPESLAFVDRLFGELLPNFGSGLVNACLDEPFELCFGKNRGGDRAALYTAYANRLHARLQNRGLRMAMWDDVAVSSNEALQTLDEDILLLDWGYEREHPFSERARRLSEAGRPFCVCPGTNSWLSFTGMTDNMFACAASAADAAYRYKAEGLLMTDWGDSGHLQYLPVSYPGFLAGAAYAWNPRGAAPSEVAEALDRLVFCDSAGAMGRALLAAGTYDRKEEFRLPCRTLASTVLTTGLVPRERYLATVELLVKSQSFFSKEAFVADYLRSYEQQKAPDFAAVLAVLEEADEALSAARPQTAEGKTALAEVRNGILMAACMTKTRAWMLSGTRPADLAKELGRCIRQHRQLWHARNKAHGCEEGLRPLLDIEKGAKQ